MSGFTCFAFLPTVLDSPVRSLVTHCGKMASLLSLLSVWLELKH